MKRLDFIKYSFATLAGLVIPREKVSPRAGESLHYQQDPPVDWHYADRATAITTNGTGLIVDLSSLDPNIKIVHGYLYAQDNQPGMGTWLIETRPTGLVTFPPNIGWQMVVSHAPDAAQVGIEMAARCGNDGRFELRLTRAGANQIEWAFAPVWWWS